MHFRRIIWTVLDSVGIGEMPDAVEYGDTGSDTLGNIARSRPLHLPNLCRLGLANIRPLEHLLPDPSPLGAFGRCALCSPGKDTTTGHWEMAGIHLDRPFPVYPNGFPAEVMDEFVRRTGKKWLGNVPASGTEIIQRLGAEHMRTGWPIIYTSADSVFQVAAHEGIISLDELYRICKVVRDMLCGPHQVGRVIARPFVGTPGSFQRTAYRRDYPVPPPEGMLLDRLSERNVPVHSIGKVCEVFLHRGITDCVKTKDNEEGMTATLRLMRTSTDGLIFVNLNDFDQLYGHRNDVKGYGAALERADEWLATVLAAMESGDLLIVTADHGCDPTTPSTDHSREYVPLLVYGPGSKRGVCLGTCTTLSDIGQTVAENFRTHIEKGASFLTAII